VAKARVNSSIPPHGLKTVVIKAFELVKDRGNFQKAFALLISEIIATFLLLPGL
jgi:hypothetical protein